MMDVLDPTAPKYFHEVQSLWLICVFKHAMVPKIIMTDLKSNHSSTATNLNMSSTKWKSHLYILIHPNGRQKNHKQAFGSFILMNFDEWIPWKQILFNAGELCFTEKRKKQPPRRKICIFLDRYEQNIIVIDTHW